MTTLGWWSLFFGLCVLLELSSPGYFFFLSFCIGALAAAALSTFDVPVAVEFGVFLVVSLGSFLLLRRYAAQLARKKTIRTNMDALRGKKGVVLDQITPFTRGWIKIDGEVWAAIPTDDSSIEKDEFVEVVGSAGSHVKVKKLTTD